MHPLDVTAAARLKEWIPGEAEEYFHEPLVAHLHHVCDSLPEPYDPCDMMPEGQWEAVKAELRQAGITPAMLRQAAGEYERAEGQTLREWMQASYKRRFPEEQAERLMEGVAQVIETHATATDPDDPVTPADILMYRVVLRQIGAGISTVPVTN